MHRLRLVPLLCLLAASLAVARGRTEAAETLGPATRDFHQRHLDIEVEPDLERGLVNGRVTITFEALADSLQRVRLHSLDTRILAVTDEEAGPLDHTLDGGVLTVHLPATLRRNEVSKFTVVYRSQPKRGLYFHRPTPRHPKTPTFMYSQGQSNDNRRWIPCYDLPDDRCRWDLKVTVDDLYQTVSNGTLTNSVDHEDGKRTDHWTFDARSPTYLISLIVGRLQTVTDQWRDVVLEYSAVPGYEEELRTSLGQTPDMMEFFSEYTGQQYPWPRYAQTYVWDFVYGGMENTTATTLNMRALHRAAARPNYTSEGLVAHELAHMWFGDLLTCRTWDGIWLNEGFATYFTDLFFEHRDGADEFRLRRRRQNEGYMNGTPNAASLGLSPHPRGDRPLELFGGKQYNRGAAILHMLRLELGDEVVRTGIRAYVARHKDQQVTSEMLRQAVEEVAGRDLSWFWDQWVYGAGYPVLDVRYDRRTQRLTVRQTQERKNGQGLFRFTLPVRLGADGEVQHLRIWKDNHVFHLPHGGDASAIVRVGVGGDLLARIRFDQPRDVWVRALAEEPDVTGRLDAIKALEPYGAGVADALAKALAEDASWAVRQAAAEALAEMDTHAVAGAALLAAVTDADPRVRETVLEGLGRRTRDEAGAAVIRAAQGETHDYPRAAAARAVGRLKVEGAYDVLRALLRVDSHGDCVRAGAFAGLAALGDLRGADLAGPFCDYEWGKGGNHRMRMAALDCILELAPDADETHRLLTGLLEDPFDRMRSRAAEECGVYAVQAARRALQRLAQHDGNGGVKNAAQKALARLDEAQ
ncbi:MAG: M1 family aminopeptidase [Planctomycetota bacterium]|jgi:aminopeptidase N